MSESRRAARPAAAVAPFLPIILVGVIHLAAILLSLPGVVLWTKPLLMPALAIGLIWAAPERRSPAIVLGVTALVLSAVGDVTLVWFVIGLTFFLLAHGVYLVLFVTRLAVRRLPGWTVVYAVWLVILLTILAGQTGALLVPVIAYGVVLCAMAAVASRCNAWVAGGGALFVLSDSILAINTFLPDARIPLADFLIMATYLLAQTLIVCGLLRHEQARLDTADTTSVAARTD